MFVRDYSFKTTGFNQQRILLSQPVAMELHWLAFFGAWFIGSSAFTGHLLIVFYSKDFVWDDLTPKLAIEKSKAYYHQNPCVHWKFWVCGLAMVMCRSGWVSMLQGQLLMLLLALPQLYRAKGEPSRQLRVILGPLTPILSVNNLLQSCCVASVVQFIICFLAFVVFRPDNTSVSAGGGRRTKHSRHMLASPRFGAGSMGVLPPAMPLSASFHW